MNQQRSQQQQASQQSDGYMLPSVAPATMHTVYYDQHQKQPLQGQQRTHQQNNHQQAQQLQNKQLQLNSGCNLATINQISKPATSLSSLSSSTKIRSLSLKDKNPDVNVIGSLSQNRDYSSYSTLTLKSNTKSDTIVMGSNTSSQCKRKRAKLVELLVNTSWQKTSQVEKNLSKLRKLLASCDANFVDEKTGETLLSLAASSTYLHQSTNSPTFSDANLQPKSFAGHPSNSPSLQLNQILNAPAVERVLVILVRFGAQLDLRNKDGKTALHVAAIKSNFWALKTLLELG